MREGGLPRSRLSEDESGFTVIEFVVAISLLLVSLLAASQMLTSGMQVSGDTRSRVVAANLATQSLEAIRATATDPSQFSTLTPGRTVTTQTVGATTYTITKDVQWVGQRATASNCDAGGGGTQILRATAVITWPRMHNTAPVQSATTFSPPVGAFSSNAGSVAAKVINAAAAPVSFVTVTATGATTQSIVTASDGCAFFANLTPGTYTVTVAAAGYVGDQEISSPSQSASVSSGQTAALTFNYDQAATVTVTGFTGATPAATNIKISVANTSLQPYGLYTFGLGTTTLAPLYPFPTGYTLFAGSCTDANPLGLNNSRNAFYPSANTTPVAVTPAGSSTGTVPLYPLAVSVVNTSNVAVGNATVSVLATATNGTCPGGSPTYGLPNTTTAAPIGQTTAGVPLGHYTITATSGTKTGSVKVWVQPGGTYAVDASGNATTLFTAPVKITVA